MMMDQFALCMRLRVTALGCGVPLLLAACAGCPESITPLPTGAPWTRHTIDDSFRGADGVKLGDANADGLTDLVVGWEQSGVVVVYFNPGPAQATSRWPAATVGHVTDVEDAVFVDLDADGAPDVVSSCEGSTQTMFVHWAPHDPTRSSDPAAWETAALPAAANVRQWMFCEPAQIDGINGVDLVAGAKGEHGQVGYLAAPDDPRDLNAWTWHPLADAAWIMSIVTFDLDSDGDIDIVYTDRKGERRGAHWLENPGVGANVDALWRRHAIGTGGAEFMFGDVADFDADGQPEVVAATNQRQALLYEPPAVSGLAWLPTPITWSGAYGTGKSARFGDIDLDGALDIVFACENAGSRTGVGWLAQANINGLTTWIARPISGTAGAKFDLVQLLDLDGDGDLDAITTEESANLGLIWYENPNQ